MVPSTLPSGCVTLTMAMIGMILIGDLKYLDQKAISSFTDTLANYLG